MKRKVPVAPQLRERELDRALDLVAAPRLPEGLAARIKADVTRLPQDAPVTASEPRPAVRAVAPVVPLRTPMAARLQRRWVGAGAGFAALAAGLAVFALVGAPRQDDPVGPARVVQDAAPALAALPAAPSSPVAPAPERLVATTPSVSKASTRIHSAPAPLAAPEAPLAPEPEVLAAALPPVATDGPVAAPDADTAVPLPGARGHMGPAVPQGFGYTGGAPGSIPSSAPVTMSGGPGMGAPRGGPGPRP